MSDIDDILAGFDSAASEPQGASRYIPNPQDFVDTNAEQVNSGIQGMKSAASDIYNQGLGPSNAFQAAMAGLQYLGAPVTAFGRYLGNPVERGVSDLTGSPTTGKVIGDTVALAPSVIAFPGARGMKTMAESAGGIIGEGQAARSVGENAAPWLASKFAPAAASAARSDIDDILEEAGPRMTTKAKTLEEEIALKWYQDQFKGGGAIPDVPMDAPDAQTIRLLNKGNPKVGERTYAGDKDTSHVMPYQNLGERPTYRTSHLPKDPMESEAPLSFYENAFRREFEPSAVELGSQPAQMPLLPGRNPALAEMYLPNLRQEAETDPKLLAELKLKFGGGSPQGGADAPWTPQQNAGVRPPAEMPIPGSAPMQQQNTVVQFPSDNMPVPMGKEARGNTNRLRGDLGLPPDPKEALRGKPPIPDNPGTPANPGISNYGEVVIGQPYDIVHAVGANEMRAPGGLVKEMTNVNEPIMRNGKVEYQPTVYAVLEDGRKVPAKMLKPAGAQQPNVSAMGKSASRDIPAAKSPAASSEAEADPAFEKLRAQMQAKVDAAVPSTGKPGGPNVDIENAGVRTYDPKDIASVIKAIKDARPTADAPVYYADLKERIPGVSKAMLDRAYSKIKEKNPALKIFTHTEKGPYLTLDKNIVRNATSSTAKTEQANRAIKVATENGKLKELYLRNMRPHIIQNKDKDLEVSELSMVRHLNKMMSDGDISIHLEGSPDKTLKKVTADILGGDHEEDYVVKFLKKAKKPKAD